MSEDCSAGPEAVKANEFLAHPIDHFVLSWPRELEGAFPCLHDRIAAAFSVPSAIDHMAKTWASLAFTKDLGNRYEAVNRGRRRLMLPVSLINAILRVEHSLIAGSRTKHH